MDKYHETIENISPLSKINMHYAKKRLDNLIKPKDSLGKLEAICVQLAGITKSNYFDLDKKILIAYAADHGVYDEGVSTAPQETTYLQIPNFKKGLCAAGVLAKYFNSDILSIDIGINTDNKLKGVEHHKIRKGTSNIAKGAAMTREEALKSIETGIQLTEKCINNGYSLIGIGEMGISNTTPSSAIIALITGLSVEKVTGRGAGLNDDKLANKIAVINRALLINKPDKTDGIDILSKIGGFEIGGMVGSILACASNNVPIVIDGLISYAAALIAYTINPLCSNYLIASHKSGEPGSQSALEILNLSPMFDLNMKLGEGSGAVLAFNIIEAANQLYKKMATFDEVYIGQNPSC